LSPAIVERARPARSSSQGSSPPTANRRRDFLDHAVDEIFLLGIAGQVLERQDGNRRLVGQGRVVRGRRRRLGNRPSGLGSRVPAQSGQAHISPQELRRLQRLGAIGD
jgi:hypothetical protein